MTTMEKLNRLIYLKELQEKKIAYEAKIDSLYQNAEDKISSLEKELIEIEEVVDTLYDNNYVIKVLENEDVKVTPPTESVAKFEPTKKHFNRLKTVTSKIDLFTFLDTYKYLIPYIDTGILYPETIPEIEQGDYINIEDEIETDDEIKDMFV